MEFFITLYQTFLYQPTFNLLVFLVQIIPGGDFGIGVILLTLLFRGITAPLAAQGIRMQQKMAEIQPKLKEIQEKFKDKREEQTKAMLALYREANINPFAMFLPLLVQLPVFIVLYQMFANGIQPEQLETVYSFIPRPETLSSTFLGVMDLNERSVVFAVLAGVLQFVQFKQASPKKQPQKGKKPDMASMMQTQMTYIFPVVIVWIAATLPAAFALYWVTSTTFSLGQHRFITKRESHVKQPTTTTN